MEFQEVSIGINRDLWGVTASTLAYINTNMMFKNDTLLFRHGLNPPARSLHEIRELVRQGIHLPILLEE